MLRTNQTAQVGRVGYTTGMLKELVRLRWRSDGHGHACGMVVGGAPTAH
jgi:hypothetical protein